MLSGSFKITLSPFKKQMHHNPKLRVSGCGIKHLVERIILSKLDNAVDEVRFYTDSQIVLHYLQNESKKPPSLHYQPS